jgi:hypothetical protein
MRCEVCGKQEEYCVCDAEDLERLQPPITVPHATFWYSALIAVLCLPLLIYLILGYFNLRIRLNPPW